MIEQLPPLSSDPAARWSRLLGSLTGLSIGDAFGDQFFVDRKLVEDRVLTKSLPPGPWFWTDDTNMALSVADNLRTYDCIHQDSLAQSFVDRYDYQRGYGPSMHRVIRAIPEVGWYTATTTQFGGQGSYGNGAAMRVAPLGAYFADDIETAIAQATLSAVVTHSHNEAIAGAVAVAVTAALVSGRRADDVSPVDLLKAVAHHTPESHVRDLLRRTERFTPDTSFAFAAAVLGTGGDLSAQDTVPFALWVAAFHLHDFEAAMWTVAEEATDVDTVGAITGGVIGSAIGRSNLPSLWLDRREPLPQWAG
jgi:ADP-ribosylglycohydrolase